MWCMYKGILNNFHQKKFLMVSLFHLFQLIINKKAHISSLQLNAFGNDREQDNDCKHIRRKIRNLNQYKYVLWVKMWFDE